MNTSPAVVVCALLCLHAVQARAQDAEAVSRAQRDAGNPLRMIIEASRLKRPKPAEPEPVAKAPPEKPVARPAPARAAAATPAPETTPATAVAARAEPAQPEPVAPVELPPQPTQAIAEAIAPAALPLAAKAAPQPEAEPPAAPPAPTQIALSAPASAASAKPAAPGAAAAAPSRAVLQIADYVAPVLTDRARRRLQSDGEVVLSFTVNPDGTVADAAVQSSSDRALDPIALDAVRQWRYQPIAAAQAHAVQLVFKLRE